MFGTPAFCVVLSAAPSSERTSVVEIEIPLWCIDKRTFLNVYVEPRSVVVVRVGEYLYLLSGHVALAEHDPQLPRLFVA